MIDYKQLYFYSQQLLILDDVLQDEAGQSFVELLQLLAKSDPDPVAVGRVYARLFGILAEEAAMYSGETTGNAWQNHLLDRLLDSSCVLARKARREAPAYSPTAFFQEARTPAPLGVGLSAAAGHDLTRLQSLYRLDATVLALEVRERLNSPDLPAWSGLMGLEKRSEAEPARLELKQALAASKDWPALLPRLTQFYATYDTSEFARYTAFRWERHPAGRGGQLHPVRYVDRQNFESLVGYEKERAVIIANTQQLLAGLSANHVLLYGARGTGKSSTVKALLSRYAGRGLRLIEVHKSELGDFPLIVEAVRARPEKFILFVDDLSFEPEEVSYKDLKALLEGSLEARPANLLIYATSNRRHLIKEQFSDNARPGDEEVNAWDTVEEKLSLSDRFGLIVTFLTPNQQQYLAIVDGLAKQAGIELEAEELHRRALRWELSHSGRSGRTARQFVDQLAGELQLKHAGPPVE